MRASETQPLSVQQTARTAAPAEPASAAARALLGDLGPGLFAVLDAARDRRILTLLSRCGEKHASLFTGGRGAELADHGPHLVELPPGSDLTGTLLEEGWGRSWGVYVHSSEPFTQIVESLQRLLIVQDEDERRLYFRFYDPRVLRLFLPMATAPQGRLFFDAVSAFMMEGDDPRTVLTFTREAP